MNAKALVITILIFTAPFGAIAQETCAFVEESPDNCARFVGCLNEGEVIFKGTSRGWEAGKIYGETDTGAICTGTWNYDGRIDKGEGKLDCSDGESVNINFFARGETVQAITGVAMTKNGKRARLWGSSDLAKFFKEQFPDGPFLRFRCGDTWIPLPTEFPDSAALPPTD